MSEEYDAETLELMHNYGNCDPRVPHEIEVEVLREYDEEWPLDTFRKLIRHAVGDIPVMNRDSAVVTLTESGALSMTYRRLQNVDEVAAYVTKALEYARRTQVTEREVYKRLQKKFGG
jgi:hypothetical protein